jgi:hypothetical protein
MGHAPPRASTPNLEPDESIGTGCLHPVQAVCPLSAR